MNRVSLYFDTALARTPRQHVNTVRDAAGSAGREMQRVAAVVGLMALTLLLTALVAGCVILGGRQ